MYIHGVLATWAFLRKLLSTLKKPPDNNSIRLLMDQEPSLFRIILHSYDCHRLKRIDNKITKFSPRNKQLTLDLTKVRMTLSQSKFSRLRTNNIGKVPVWLNDVVAATVTTLNLNNNILVYNSVWECPKETVVFLAWQTSQLDWLSLSSFLQIWQ